jgi:hypothetical protein
MPRMNPEWKAKWVAALRSGEYKQGRHFLRKIDDTFCCLGVLCDLVAKEDPYFRWEKNSSNSAFNMLIDDKMPSAEVYAFIEYSSEGDRMMWEARSRGTCLSEMNDAGHTFTEIADIIEKEF